jgi:predicted nucleic acid-binding protein
VSFLVDTCAISEFAAAAPNPKVAAWFESQAPGSLFLSVLTFGEIEKGLALLEPGRRQRALAAWLGELRASYEDRILPVDETVAAIWGRLTAEARKRGQVLTTIDGLIAATAQSRGFAVVTRNLADFEAAGITLINPWAD